MKMDRYTNEVGHKHGNGDGDGSCWWWIDGTAENKRRVTKATIIVATLGKSNERTKKIIMAEFPTTYGRILRGKNAVITYMCVSVSVYRWTVIYSVLDYSKWVRANASTKCSVWSKRNFFPTTCISLSLSEKHAINVFKTSCLRRTKRRKGEWNCHAKQVNKLKMK